METLTSMTKSNFANIESVCEEVEKEIKSEFSSFADEFGTIEWQYIRKALQLHYKTKTCITRQDVIDLLCYAYHRRASELEEQTALLTEWLTNHNDFSITKEQEIALIEKLCYTDSAFAKEFREYFLRLKDNILNDKPILHKIQPSIIDIDNY